MSWALLKLIAIAEFVTGAIAFVFACTALNDSIHADQSLAISLITAAFGFGVAILTAGAGFLLFFDSPRGLPLSIAAQWLQVVQLTTSPVTYQVVMGYAVTVFVRGSGFIGVGAEFGDIHTWLSFGGSATTGIAINFAAVGIASLLMRESNRLRATPKKPRLARL
jgi:hypothetical protein